MLIEGINLNWAHIYGDALPDHDGRPGRNKAAVQAVLDDNTSLLAEAQEYFFGRGYGFYAGRQVFKATSLHRCRVEVVGGVTRWRDLLGQMEILDVANVDRNRIFTSGPVSIDVEPGVREEGVRASGFIHLNRIIVDVDKLDIWKVLK
jgi:hypothetical protein